MLNTELKSRSYRSDPCISVYDPCIHASGTALSLALVIYTEIVLVILNAFDVTLTFPGLPYHFKNCYGGRCERYHLCPCTRRDGERKNCEVIT